MIKIIFVSYRIKIKFQKFLFKIMCKIKKICYFMIVWSCMKSFLKIIKLFYIINILVHSVFWYDNKKFDEMNRNEYICYII